jgi:3-oxoacyl-[acyl-carrier-protein] synthase II
MLKKRIVVTGIGLETCLGRDLNEVWESLLAGKSGIRPISMYQPLESASCKVAGEIDFDPLEVMTGTEARRTTRFQQLVWSAASRAVKGHSDLVSDPYRFAIVVGTGGGFMPYAQESLEQMAGDRLALLKTLPNMAAAIVAQRLGICGPSITISTACASSTDAIGYALQLIRTGVVDAALACGVDAWVTQSSVGHFAAMKVTTSRNPLEATEASRPFDKDRDGMVPAEGGGALLLETLERANRRGAKPMAELLGAGSTCDAHHLSAPLEDGSVAAASIEHALTDAGLVSERIDHVNAHGTSTRLNDIVETRALKRALGGRAYEVPVTAPKSMLGHACGGCGIIEAAITILTLRDGLVPPTINLLNPDPECDLDYVTNKARTFDGRTALTVNFGFGGQNSALIFRKFDQGNDGG